jgi:hypothetical protein
VKRFRKMLWLVTILAGIAQANAQPAGRIPISASQVAEAITSSGTAVNAGQVQFLAQVDAAREDASLRVVSVKGSIDGATDVKLRCQDNRECLPFYVLIHNARPARFTDGYAKPVSIATRSGSADNTSSAGLMRSGDRATLILEEADFRISMPVICLEAGMRGQQIRVASKDGRRFYKGEVMSSGILKGRL